MWLIQAIILVVLLLIFVQDMQKRSVYWWFFPVLLVSFFAWGLFHHQSIAELCLVALINICFLTLQFLLTSLYFSIKYKRVTNLVNGFIGWGDILFLVCISFYLSVLNLVLFYIISLLAIVAFQLLLLTMQVKKDKRVPLAGLQAFLLACFLVMDWWFVPLNLTNDNWLLSLLNK